MASSAKKTLKIVTLNVQGLSSRDKQLRLLSFLDKWDFHIVCLQETKIRSINQVSFISRFFARTFVSLSPDRSAGVVVLVSKSFPGRILSHFHDHQGRIVVMDFVIDGNYYRLVNGYAPPNRAGKPAWYTSLPRYCGTATNLILAGDWNFVMDPAYDQNPVPSTNPNPQIRNIMSKLMTTHKLVDCWNHCHGYLWGGTFFRTGYAARLDRVYITSTQKSYLSQCSTLAVNRPNSRISDHLAVSIELDITHCRRGHGFWRLNMSLLDDPSIMSKISETARKYSEHSEEDVLVRWDQCKSEWRGILLDAGKQRASNRRNELRFLLRVLEIMQNSRRKSQRNSAEMQSILAQIFDLTSNASAGMNAVNARSNSHEVTSLMSVLVDDVEVIEPEAIQAEGFQFFSALHQVRTTIPSAAINQFLSNVAPVFEEDPTVGPITSGQLLAAIKALPKGKAPGPDGFPVEFYECIWSCISEFFTEVVNFAIDNPDRPVSFGQSFTKLLPKKGDRRLLSNWRPISCVSSEWKVIMRVLLNRVYPYANDLLSPLQFAGAPGRSSLDLLTLMRCVHEYSQYKRINLAMISVDQMKAFDNVEHQFLFQLLGKVGLSGLSSVVQGLYSRAENVVVINGEPCPPYAPTRGLRQGCPASPFLYALVIGVLMKRVQEDASIHGLPVPGLQTELKMVAFADDLTCLVRNGSSVERLMQQFDAYSAVSGGKINYDKSSVVWWGQRFTVPLHHGQALRSVNELTVLGVPVPLGTGHNFWRLLSSRVAESLQRPAVAGLQDFSARVRMYNQYVTSHLAYPCSVFPFPRSCAQRLLSVTFPAIWAGGHHWLNRQVFMNPLNEGGWAVVDPYQFGRAVLLRASLRALCSDSDVLYAFCRYLCGWHVRYLMVEQQPARFPLPKAEQPSAFFQSLVTVAQDVRRQFQGDPLSQTAVALARQLRTSTRPRIERLLPHFDWKVAWEACHAPFLQPKVRDVNWRAAHEVLPVRQVLCNRFRVVSSPNCLRCGQAETVGHALVHCPWLAPLWQKLHIPRRDSVIIYFQSFPPSFSPALFTLLVSQVKYLVWIYRGKESPNLQAFLLSQAIRRSWKKISRYKDKRNYEVTWKPATIKKIAEESHITLE